ITIAVPGRRLLERSVVLEPGERHDLTIAPADLAPLPAAASAAKSLEPAAPAPPDERARRRRWGGRLAVAGTVIAAAGGAALWIAKDKVEAIDRAKAGDRPFDESTGNYRGYEVAGAVLIASGVAALLSGAGL